MIFRFGHFGDLEASRSYLEAVSDRRVRRFFAVSSSGSRISKDLAGSRQVSPAAEWPESSGASSMTGSSFTERRERSDRSGVKLEPVIELAEELGGHGALGETCREPAKSLERRLERRRNCKESSIPNDLVALGALFWQFFNSLVYRSQS